MSEKFNPEDLVQHEYNLIEYEDLLSKAEENLSYLSSDERKRLVEFGYYYLDVEKNKYEAMKAFEATQDFEGLRKVANRYQQEHPNSHDLSHILTLLEDHEGIRDLLNRGVKATDLEYGNQFNSLDESLDTHVRLFLDENKTPVATGTINQGIDLVAIYNLSHKYDIAVPIARGGLNQGAIANLWGMPTKIINISAHNKRVPKGKWVNPVTEGDIEGKNILLFDKDAVSGASINKAVSMLEAFKPASIGVYFTHRVLENGKFGIGTITSGLPKDIEIFSPKNAPLEQAGDVYIEAHEKLGTLYGRRRQIEKLFKDEAKKIQEDFPVLAESFIDFLSEQLSVFDSLNPNLPGIREVREQILLRMNNLYQDHLGYIKNNIYKLPGTLESFNKILSTTEKMPVGFESEIINALFKKQGEDFAKKRGIENIHYPSNPLSAFNASRKAIDGGFDILLIVGPEGFAYEPYFHDSGLSTMAINIPESGEKEPRTIKTLDNTLILKDKKVLVVEDDVSTGATLQKIIEYLGPYNLKDLGLYLGQPKKFQKVDNIPAEFKKIYISEDNENTSKEFSKYLESKGLKVFKDKKQQDFYIKTKDSE